MKPAKPVKMPSTRKTKATAPKKSPAARAKIPHRKPNKSAALSSDSDTMIRGRPPDFGGTNAQNDEPMMPRIGAASPPHRKPNHVNTKNPAASGDKSQPVRRRTLPAMEQMYFA